MANRLESLKNAELFLGLSDEDLSLVEPLCREVMYPTGKVICRLGEPVDDLYLIIEGSVEVLTQTAAPSGETPSPASVRVVLGKGQTFGEMGLVDRGARSATVRVLSSIEAYAIDCAQFLDLCERQPRLGLAVMRNIAVDLSFKLRHGNLM